MFQLIRKVDAKNAALVPAALQFGGEVTAYLKKTYSIDVKYGAALFSGASVYWLFQADSLDKIHALNSKLLADREYGAMLLKVKDLWVDGSFEDTIVSLVG